MGKRMPHRYQKEGMAASGHQKWLPLPRLSGRCGFSEGTVANRAKCADDARPIGVIGWSVPKVRAGGSIWLPPGPRRR